VDAVGAVALAAKAVELRPAEGAYWNTLGVAHYRAEEWQAAIDALTNRMSCCRRALQLQRLLPGDGQLAAVERSRRARVLPSGHYVDGPAWPEEPN